MRALIATSLLAATLLATSDARAEDDVAAARRLFQEAVAASEHGDWSEAVTRYQASLARKRAPITLYSLGVAYREAGHPLEAWHRFRAFLAEPFEDPDAAVYRRAAREALEEMTHAIGRIVVVTEPGEATVTVDGEPCAAASEPCFVAPGTRRVVVTAAGFVSEERVVKVNPGDTETLRVTLEPSSVPLWPIALVGGGAATFGVGVGLAVAGIDHAEAKVGPSVAGNVLIGAGLGSAAVGAVLLALRPEATTADVAVRPWSDGTQVGVALSF